MGGNALRDTPVDFEGEDGEHPAEKHDPPSWHRFEDEPISPDQSCLATRSQVDFPLPGTYPPCGKWIYEEGRACESTERVIVHLFSNSGKKLVCGLDHHVPHKGNAFINPTEFGPGGDFYGKINAAFVPDNDSILKGRWKIPAARQSFLKRFKTCAFCGSSPFQGGSDKGASWDWLRQNDQELFGLVQAALRGKGGGFELSTWFDQIGLPLSVRVRKRLDKSSLSFDHGVARKIGNEHWLQLSTDQRTVLRVDLVFKLCKHCNLGKSSRLEPRDKVEEMYVRINFDGSLPAAKADAPRWMLLQGALDVVYEVEKLV